MKNIFLIAGIVILIACILSLLFAIINMLGYQSLRDGTAEHYSRLHTRIILFFWIGIILAVIEVACIVLYFKL